MLLCCCALCVQWVLFLINMSALPKQTRHGVLFMYYDKPVIMAPYCYYASMTIKFGLDISQTRGLPVMEAGRAQLEVWPAKWNAHWI